MTRLAVLISHPIPYFTPLYAKLAERFDLTVLYASREGVEERFNEELGTTYSWGTDLLSGYDYRFLPSLRKERKIERFFGLINPQAFTLMNRNNFDLALIHGWATATMWLGFAGATARRLPFFITGDSADLYALPAWKATAKMLVLRSLFSAAAGALYSGTLNREFYEKYGIKRDRLFFGPWSVDNERFAPPTNPREAEDARLETRSRYGIDPATIVILFSGKFVERKRPLDLVESVGRARTETGASIEIVFAGEGPLRQAIEERAKELKVVTHQLGFVPQDDMPAVYQMSDVFCLPSEKDPRGTVSNEAMAAGLPLVIAKGVGIWGEGDLLRHDENGYLIEIGDVAALSHYISHLATDRSVRLRFGTRSREIVANWSHDQYVEGVEQAAAEVAGSRKGV